MKWPMNRHAVFSIFFNMIPSFRLILASSTFPWKLGTVSVGRLSSCLNSFPVIRRNISFSAMPYSTIERGSPNSIDYRLYIKDENGPISPFHDIPLFANESKKIFNIVVEIPRWTNAKMEINKEEVLNPIKQDVKKGKLRYVANCFPHHGYIWNYGAIPQTWENPDSLDEHTGCKGDDDPIDVLEIGYRVAKRGEVIQVKVLGIMALIDEGETDWKVICIDVKDPLAAQMNDIEDVEKQMPGLLKATVEWFRIYKIPDGKPENKFAFNAEAKNVEFAHKIIAETNKHWQSVIRKESDSGSMSLTNVSIKESPFKIDQNKAEESVKCSPAPGPAQPIEDIVDKWHYLQLK